MTKDEAIQSLMESCEDMAKTIEFLMKQNEILVDIICRLNMGEITKEEMMAEFDKIQKGADALAYGTDSETDEPDVPLAEKIRRAEANRKR